jgi:hypothetical protein
LNYRYRKETLEQGSSRFRKENLLETLEQGSSRFRKENLLETLEQTRVFRIGDILHIYTKSDLQCYICSFRYTLCKCTCSIYTFKLVRYPVHKRHKQECEEEYTS